MDTLREKVRVLLGREGSPSLGIIDSRSVKTSQHVDKDCGIDGNKKIKGRKEQLLTDTLRLPLGIFVHEANIHDRKGTEPVFEKIAKLAQFFSFGTNDLTQMTFGFSRDDVNAIVKDYIEEKIIPADPFNTLDQEGVGQLVKLGVERGRSQRANLKCGVCGEHGGDPASVRFFYKAGLNYVSCSPFRVPVARLAAAQAAIEEERGC